MKKKRILAMILAVAENAWNFAIAYCRVDVGIDPYGDFAWSPHIVRFCVCALQGRGKTPPLRRFLRRGADVWGLYIFRAMRYNQINYHTQGNCYGTTYGNSAGGISDRHADGKI